MDVRKVATSRRWSIRAGRPFLFALSLSLTACAGAPPGPTGGQSTSPSYPIDLAPARMTNLPPELRPYEADWPDYWKGTVRGTRLPSESEISDWMVELLGPPVRMGDYCLAQGRIWRYAVDASGLVPQGSDPAVSGRYHPGNGDCLATGNEDYFQVDPRLAPEAGALVDAAAVAFDCLELRRGDGLGRPGPVCASASVPAALISRLLALDPYRPLSVAMGEAARPGARTAWLSYLETDGLSSSLIRLRFGERAGAWQLLGAEARSIQR